MSSSLVLLNGRWVTCKHTVKAVLLHGWYCFNWICLKTWTPIFVDSFNYLPSCETICLLLCRDCILKWTKKVKVLIPNTTLRMITMQIFLMLTVRVKWVHLRIACKELEFVKYFCNRDLLLCKSSQLIGFKNTEMPRTFSCVVLINVSKISQLILFHSFENKS